MKYLQDTFKNTDNYNKIKLVFEYWIPLSCYRRPDIIMFYKNTLLVLEFKRKDILLEIDKQNNDNVYRWLSSQYMPLRDIIDATTDMFINGKIPEIK